MFRSDLEKGHDLLSGVILDLSLRDVQLSKLYFFSENKGKEWTGTQL